MSELSKQQLSIENSNSFPNNNAGLITPALLRGFNNDMIDSTVNQTAFNGYTGSNDQRVSSLETNSGSVNTSVSALNQFTASQSTGSFATTGSNTFIGNQNISGSILFPNGTEIRGNVSQQTILFSPTSSLLVRSGVNLTITGSSVSIQGLQYPNTDGTNGQVITTNGVGNLSFTTITAINTGSFATTGSNSFVGNQTITGSVTISGSAAVDVDVIGTVRLSGPGAALQVSASNGQSLITSNTIQVFPASLGNALITNQFGGNVAVIRANNLEIGFVGDATTGSIGGWNQGPAFYVNNDPGNTYKGVFGFQNKQTFTDGRVAVLTPLSASAGFTASLQSGHVWAGNSLGQNAQVATSSFGGSTDTGSLMVTGSVAGNVLTFTKGDASTFNLTVDTGSGGGGSTDTGSLMVTGSIAGNILTFTKGDASTFDLTIPSATGSVFDTGSFATTGSNTFVGNQTITSAGNTQLNIESSGGGQTNLDFKGNNSNFQAHGDFRINNHGQFGGSGSINFIVKDNEMIFGATQGFRLGVTNTLGNGIEGGNVQINIPSGSSQLVLTGSMNVIGALTASIQEGFVLVGNSSNISTLVATSSFGGGGGGQTFAFPSVESISGSFLLSRNGVTSGSAGISHITSSTPDLVNIIIKSNNNTTPSTIISGSGNIFTNLPSISGDRVAHMTNANLALFSGITSLTASAASVSGNRPQVNGNIFTSAQGSLTPFTINQSPNGGNHNYSANILNGGGLTINALGSVGSMIIQGNIGQFSSTINSPSRSIAEINAGETGSNFVNITNNHSRGGTINYHGPVSHSVQQTHTISSNLLGSAGTGMALNLQSGSRQYTITNNLFNGALFLNDNTQFSPTLGGASNSISNNLINSNVTINQRASSSISATGNVGGGFTINNDHDGSPETINVGQRSVSVSANTFVGASFTINASGSATGSTGLASKIFARNIMAGTSNTVNLVGDGAGNNITDTGIIGSNLTISGSFGNIQGGLFAGRFNATDGNRAKTAETIFAVGTGTSAANRKTGFLIDSGSNTFVEGTLNVSGSTAITGAVSITETLQLSALDPLPAGADGQLAVSASNLYFFSGSNWNQIAFV